MTSTSPVRATADPPPGDLDWAALVAICERRGIPVTRVVRGTPHLLRSAADLAETEEKLR